MPHDPIAALLDMAGAIERAFRLCAGMSLEEFLLDERAQWAVFSQIVILGEASGRVPKDFQEAHPQIPWSSAIGMRHRLVHGYDTVNWERVWRTLTDDLPPLLEHLQPLIPNPPSTEDNC